MRPSAPGSSRIRVASEVPHPGGGAPWEGWARYEAAVNRAYAEFPLWGLCAYDTRITPGRVLDDVARTPLTNTNVSKLTRSSDSATMPCA
jgi:hypothetical protein